MASEVIEQDQQRDEVVYEEVDQLDGPSRIANLLAVATGAFVLVLGIVAAARIDWSGMTSDRLDEQLSDVMRMTFTPVMAIGTVVIGLILILLAALRAGRGEVVVGAMLAAVGIAIVAVDDVQASWNVGDRHGWLAIGVGVVFVLAGFITDHGTQLRRSYARHAELR